MDVLDPSPPGSAGPSEESRAIDLVSQAAGAEAPGAGAAQGVAAFADRLLARWVHQAGPLGEPPLAARLLDRLWSEEPRLGTLLDFPLFEPSALGFTSRWAAEPVVGYPSAWTLPRWQVLLPPEAGEEERPEREAVAGESWFTARARQEAAEQTARARRAAGRPTGKPEQPDQLELAPPHRGAAARLQRAQQLARLQAEPRRAPWPAPARPGLPAAQAGTAATGAPRRGPTPPVAATAGDALRPYPRAMGRAGALLPRLVAERFPLHYSNLHDLAVPLAPPLPGLPDAATARAAAGTGREGERGESAGPGPARRAHAARPGGPDELRRRREHPAALLGDQAFSRTHLPALGAALSELGRSRTSHEPAHWLRNLARPGAAVAGPARAAAPGLAGDLFLGGAEGTGPALPGLPVAAKPGPGRRPSRAALAAPSLVQIGLAATADEAGEAASAMRVRAVRAPAVPLDYLWPGHPAAPAAARHERFAGPREPLTGELAASAAGFTPAALAGEPLATVGSRPGRTLEPTAAPAVLATPWPYRGVQPGAEEAEEPGWPGLDAPFAPPAMAGEPLLPPVVRGAARRAAGARLLQRRGPAAERLPAATLSLPRPAAGTADLSPGDELGSSVAGAAGRPGETDGLVRLLLGRLGLPAQLAEQAIAAEVAGPALAGRGGHLARLVRRLSRRAEGPRDLTMIRMPPGGAADRGGEQEPSLAYRGLLESVGGLLPGTAWGAFRQAVSSAFAGEAGRGELLRQHDAAGAAEPAGLRPDVALGPSYFRSPRLVGSLQRKDELAHGILQRRERGGRLLQGKGFQPLATGMALSAGEGAPLGAIPRPGGEEKAHGFHLDVDLALLQALDAWEAAFPGRTPYVTPRGAGEGKAEPDFRDQQPLRQAAPPLPARLKQLAADKGSAGRQVRGLLGALGLDQPDAPLAGIGEQFAARPGRGGPARRGYDAPSVGLDEALSMTLVRPIMQVVLQRAEVLMSESSGGGQQTEQGTASLGDKKAELDPAKIDQLVEQVYERIWELIDLEKQRRAW